MAGLIPSRYGQRITCAIRFSSRGSSRVLGGEEARQKIPFGRLEARSQKKVCRALGLE